jgi:fluoride exporter
MDFLYVGLGGLVGAILRYSVYLLEKSFSLYSFPAATLIINTLGCFASGILLSLIQTSSTNHRDLLLFLVIGILGSFTTFSTFNMDNYQMLRSGQITLAAINIFSNILLGLAAVWLGHKIS